jgi:hypothetical protein
LWCSFEFSALFARTFHNHYATLHTAVASSHAALQCERTLLSALTAQSSTNNDASGGGGSGGGGGVLHSSMNRARINATAARALVRKATAAAAA